MNRILIYFTLLIVGLTACKDAETKIDRLEIARQYYTALDHSDTTLMVSLLKDSLVTKETEYDYEQTFSSHEYIEWLKWDAVFEPSYDVIDIAPEGEIIKSRISKTDKRIQFLHEGPIVTDQAIRFEGAKIVSIETSKYVTFNDSIFVKNRDELVSWIDKNHPDMGGFLYDQTVTGGQKYLKAIQLYTSK